MSILLSYLPNKRLIQIDKPFQTSDIVLWKRQLPTILYQSFRSDSVDETQQHMASVLNNGVQIKNKFLTDDLFMHLHQPNNQQWSQFVDLVITQTNHIGCLPHVTSFTGESIYFFNFCPNKDLSTYYDFLRKARNMQEESSQLDLYLYKRARIWTLKTLPTRECLSDLSVVRRDRFRCVQDWLQYLQALILPNKEQSKIYCLQWSKDHLDLYTIQWIKALMQCIEMTSRIVYVSTLFPDHANLVICDNKQNRVLFYVSQAEYDLLMSHDIQLHLNRPIQFFVLDTDMWLCKKLCHIVASYDSQIHEHQPNLLEQIWQQRFDAHLISSIQDIVIEPHLDAEHLSKILVDNYLLQDPQQAILEHYTMEAFVELVSITDHSDLVRHISYYVANRLIFHREQDLFAYLDICVRRLQIQKITLHTWNLYDLIAFAHHKTRHVAQN